MRIVFCPALLFCCSAATILLAPVASAQISPGQISSAQVSPAQTSDLQNSAKRTPATPAQAAAAASPNGTPVPITQEPHHHLILENSYVRVFRVEIISPESTLLHRHDVPYAYMSIGKAEFTNAVQGKPEIRIQMADGQLGYSKGAFSHFIRTENDTPFYNITVELLHPQGEARSDCAKKAEGVLVGCDAAQTAVANTANKIEAEQKAPTPAASPATGNSTPLAQSAPNNSRKPAAGPPSFTAVLETAESTLKSATFPTNAQMSLDAGAAGTLLVIEPLSQFKVDFSDGSSKLLSGGDPIWIQGGSKVDVSNTSEQTSSSMLIFAFKDPQ